MDHHPIISTLILVQESKNALQNSIAPLQYQTEDGSWQPIDPRFITAHDGFTNFTNALSVSAGERVATLNLRSGDTLAQWQPLELIVTDAQGGKTTLARALDPATAAPGVLAEDGRTVRYTGSWTLAGLTEEVTAAPGAMEEKIIFASLPLLPLSGELREVSLLATLRLPASATLYADGVSHSGAFTTTGRVEIRDTAGEIALVFEPVIAYEQNNPTARTTGQYSFTLAGDGQWTVAVQTPWAWWADPARAYPVVLDPTMKMLGPITTAQLCAYYTSSPCPLTGSVDPDNGADMIYIGRSYIYGITSALIRFDDLPTLPPGYVVEEADLLIAPKNYLVGSSITDQIRVWQVTSAWDPATVYYLNNDPTIATPYLDQKYLLQGYKPAFPPGAKSFVTRFRLQTEPGGLVSGWLSGAIPNHGLLLDQPFDANCTACGDFVHIYTAPLWTKKDFSNLDPAKPFPLSVSEGSGIMLQITYAPPTLALNEPVFSDLPTFGEIYADTYHAFLPPGSGSVWTAVAVKGLEEVQYANDVIDKAAGNLRLGRGCTDPFDAGCAVKVSQGDFKQRPNFILTRGNPANTDLEAWLYPPNPDTPANAGLDAYMIAAVPSVNLPGNPSLTPGTQITHTLVMSTSEIMQLYNLNLQANTRLGVQVVANTYVPALGGEVEMPFIEARMYPPVASGKTLVKDLDGLNLGGHTHPGVVEMGKMKVGASQAGTWALALEYFGDVDPTIGDPPITYTHPLTMSVQLTFVVCANNAIPTAGGCITVSKPDGSTPYLDVGNFRVFSDAGFTCAGTYCETVLPTPGVDAPSIVWRVDWIAGQQDRWVTVVGMLRHHFDVFFHQRQRLAGE